jgi:hypothetical protein
MSEKGKGVLEAVRGFRKFMGDVALLLRTADEPLAGHGWAPEGNTATSDNSGAIYAPERWIPHYLCRFFESEKRPDVLVFVAVILDDLDSNPFPLQEPLVTAGCVKYSKEAADWEWWYAKIALWAPGFEADGNIHEFTAENVPEASDMGVLGGKVLALPLVDIEDATALEQKVIEPLVKAIG